jgi:hypothetical protein
MPPARTASTPQGRGAGMLRCGSNREPTRSRDYRRLLPWPAGRPPRRRADRLIAVRLKPAEIRPPCMPGISAPSAAGSGAALARHREGRQEPGVAAERPALRETGAARP